MGQVGRQGGGKETVAQEARGFTNAQKGQEDRTQEFRKAVQSVCQGSKMPKLTDLGSPSSLRTMF